MFCVWGQGVTVFLLHSHLQSCHWFTGHWQESSTGEGSIRIIFVSVLEVTLAVVFTAVPSQLVHHLTPVELPVPAAVRMLLLPVACTQIYQEFHCLIQHCSGPSKTHRCFTLCQDNIWKMEDCSGQTLLLNTWHFLTLSLEFCLLLQVVLLEKEK